MKVFPSVRLVKRTTMSTLFPVNITWKRWGLHPGICYRQFVFRNLTTAGLPITTLTFR